MMSAEMLRGRRADAAHGAVPKTSPGSPHGRRRWVGSRLVTVLFLGPALVILAAIVVYPACATIWYSLLKGDTNQFVGGANYAEMFSAESTRRALINNMVWVIVAPSVVCACGLVFAVLTERIRFATAFKTVLFMPLATSFLAAGVTFTITYASYPNRNGTLNNALVSIHDVFAAETKIPGARPRDNAGLVTVAVDGSTARDGKPIDSPSVAGDAVETVNTVRAGEPVYIPLLAVNEENVPHDAMPAAEPVPGPGLRGDVWIDFTPGGKGQPGVIDPGETGLPGLVVEVVRDGKVLERTKTDTAGRFAFPGLTGDGYTVRLAADNFTPPYRGVNWLGDALVTPSIIGAYIWIWAGFAMVIIAAGLAAIPRDALEAARVDGANEWQVFWRVTVPLLRPVIIVVIVTLTINVLRIFDLVYALTNQPSQPHATVLAKELFARYRENDYGVASAIGVLLFVLVLPFMVYNIRKLRREQ